MMVEIMDFQSYSRLILQRCSVLSYFAVLVLSYICACDNKKSTWLSIKAPRDITDEGKQYSLLCLQRNYIISHVSSAIKP